MKQSPPIITGLAVLAGILHFTPASAQVVMDWVEVGHAGNSADPATGSVYGAVAYDYRIGKYEVTNAQYTAFLNAADPTGTNPNGIYSGDMGNPEARGGISFNGGAASGTKYSILPNMGDKPVNNVSWYDSARFTNWLHNGQGSGSTETGAYTLNGTTGIIIKNVGAQVWIPSEDEWYKAAYYDPTTGAGGGDNYWTFSTRSDSEPTKASANTTGDISNPGTNVANYGLGASWRDKFGNVTTVGSAGALSESFFGTADQGGNLSEWNDYVIGFNRGLRGGGWRVGPPINLAASSRTRNTPTHNDALTGFRVATTSTPPDPEPQPPIVDLEDFYESGPNEEITIDATPIEGYPLNFSYQWYFNEFAIPNALGGTASQVTLTGLSADEGTWRIVVTNAEGSADRTFEYRVFTDADGDGLSDSRETLVIGSDPDLPDTDLDGLNDFIEWTTYNTSPLLPDTDGDGFDDPFEINTGFDPTLATSTPEAFSELLTAVEFRFNAAAGVTYRIESSTDLANWSAVESGIPGSGDQVIRFYSVEATPRRHFRARRE